MKPLARALTPPLLWRAGSRMWRRVAHRPPAMFSGVFEAFSQVPDEEPWTRAGYLQASRRLLRECGERRLPAGSETMHALMAFLLNTRPPGAVPRVMDWAGGTGLRYWTVRPSLNRPVEWHVVDKPELASLSREVMGACDDLRFNSGWPPADGAAFDVAMVYSSLQYVEDQAAILRTIAGYRPEFVVLPRLMARRGAPYVTRQDVHGYGTPCKVSSLEEMSATLGACGYQAVVSMEDGVDLSALFDSDVPAEYRVGKEHLLVFRRAAHP